MALTEKDLKEIDQRISDAEDNISAEYQNHSAFPVTDLGLLSDVVEDARKMAEQIREMRKQHTAEQRRSADRLRNAREALEVIRDSRNVPTDAWKHYANAILTGEEMWKYDNAS